MAIFDDNSAYLWAIIALGLAVPAYLSIYALRRIRLAKKQLERIKAAQREVDNSD